VGPQGGQSNIYRCSALVEVAADEIADFDETMKLVDWDGGDYSMTRCSCRRRRRQKSRYSETTAHL
jgi:hypothetical protein